MYWLNRHIDLTETKYELFVVDRSDKHIDFFNSYAVAVDNNEIIPAWSLIALLEILPHEIKIFGITYYIKIYFKNNNWFISYKNNNEEFIGTYSTLLIDACYEMIIKLHEQKVL